MITPYIIQSLKQIRPSWIAVLSRHLRTVFCGVGTGSGHLRLARWSSEKWNGFPLQLGAEQTVTQALAWGPHRSISHSDSVGWALSMGECGDCSEGRDGIAVAPDVSFSEWRWLGQVDLCRVFSREPRSALLSSVTSFTGQDLLHCFPEEERVLS